MKRSLFIILFIICSFIINSRNIDYGLRFQSMDVNKDFRTGLDLTCDRPLNLSDGFSLEFDLKFHTEIPSYGYVFRIIEDDVTSLDLIVNSWLQTLNFVLNDKENILSNMEFDKNTFNINKWLEVKIIVDKENITCSIDNVPVKTSRSFNSMRHLNFFFGKNGHPLFYTSDVPCMTIKNLVIKESDGKIVRNWKMFKHGDNEVFDEEKGVKASVLNGKWIIDGYTKWQKETGISIRDVNPQIAYDNKSNRIFIASNDSLIIYSVDTKEKESIAVAKGRIFRSGGSHMIFDSKKNRLLSYSILYDNFITFDFEKREWSSDQIDEGFPPLQQHNRLIDTLSNQLIIFGGYGIHTYHAELLKHDLDGGKWEVRKLSDQITPRYLSSMAYGGENKLLILGGYGNPSGKQAALSRNLYDLWEIELDTYNCKKIAQFNPPKDQHFVLGNSMIIDEENRSIYSLAYNNDRFHSAIQLMAFDWEKSTIKPLADSIPYNFLDIESFCDLVLDHESQKLYAIVLQGRESDMYNIEVYSLKYPPMSRDDIYTGTARSGLSSFLSKRDLLIWGIVSFIFIFLISIYIIKNKNIPKASPEIKEHDLAEPEKKEFIIKPSKTVSTINLLGGFQVYDSKGDDITEEFTLIVRQLFLYILINTIYGGKKITSERINDTFWLGMDKTNASNNRSVNIRKLRTLLRKVGDIEVVNKNSYWYISIDEKVNCDYSRITALIRNIESGNVFDKKQLEAILDIASAGVLLPNINAEWLDYFKSDYSNTLIDLFTRSMEQPDIRSDLKLMLKISNLILLHDSIDENAVKNKCLTLYKLGQKGSSKQCYEYFCAEYERILNAKPEFTYNDIIR